MTTAYTSLPFYHASLDRTSAEQLLRVLARPGVWLLRPSSSESVIALSQMCANNVVSHARIFVHRRTRDGQVYGFSIESDAQAVVFDNMDDLIGRLRFSIANATPVLRQVVDSAVSTDLQRRSAAASPPIVPPRQLPPLPVKPAFALAPPANVALPITAHIDVSELQFGEQIGEGSSGAVYRALLRGHVVAVKIANADAADADEQAKLESEARLMAGIPPHANVVRCFGMTSRPNLFVAMQLCANGSLYDLLMSEQQLPGAWMLKMLRDIVAGMAHLHSNNIVHRDLAARNVLLDHDYSVALVADFGMSRRMLGGGHLTKQDTAPLKWTSPEGIRERTSSEASDVWSFAMVVIEVLTRNLPFPDLDPMRTAIKVAYENLKPDAPPGCTPAIARLLHGATQTDPARRPTFVQIAALLSRESSVWVNPNL